jgi:hypothetical protein
VSKCGCAGSGGSVVFEDTPGVDITGAGTAQNPYRINVRQLYLQPQDTSTINMTITGTGSETTPYTISAEFTGTILPPDWQTSEMQNWIGAVNLSAVTKPLTIRATLTGDVTSVVLPTWTSAQAGAIYLLISQDVVGGHTWVMPGTSAGGADIVLSPAPSARDFIRAYWTGLQWVLTAEALNVS